jgi:hypothetical protein
VLVTRTGDDEVRTQVPAGQPPTPATVPVTAPVSSTSTELGVFEPVRGWIVYPVGHTLMAIDPANPASRRTLELPGGLSAGLPPDANVAPAGWSAGGTRLALSDDYSGKSYVMDATGAITTVEQERGCCIFVTTPWLSPDGTTVVESNRPDQLRLRNIDDVNASRTIELNPAVGSWCLAAWSPDSSRIACAVHRGEVGAEAVPFFTSHLILHSVLSMLKESV